MFLFNQLLQSQQRELIKFLRQEDAPEMEKVSFLEKNALISECLKKILLAFLIVPNFILGCF